MPDYTQLPQQARGLTLVGLMRDAADVKRYHTHRVLRQQTIGAHSFNMLLLLDQVAPRARKEVFQAIMHHDLPELMTGDVPAPIKRLHPELKVMMQEAEEDLTPLYRELHLTVGEEQLVKFCDTMELVLWCLEEWQMGNRYVKACIVNGLTWLWETPVTIGDSVVAQMELLQNVSRQAFHLDAINGDDLPFTIWSKINERE